MIGFVIIIFIAKIFLSSILGLYFTIYIQTKRVMETFSSNLMLNTFIAGMNGGLVATVLTNPFDVIRTRLQYRHFEIKEKKINGIVHGFKTIILEDGLSGLMRGLTPRLIRKPLANATTFVVFEGLHKFVNKEEAF